jgi:ABC-type transport system substrate-binding protein
MLRCNDGSALHPAVAGLCKQIVDPALNTWFEASNLCRNSLEYLTYVDPDNVTHPYPTQSWKPSVDLKTWDFPLRDGVRWSNGDAFTVDDVVFNQRVAVMQAGKIMELAPAATVQTKPSHPYSRELLESAPGSGYL